MFFDTSDLKTDEIYLKLDKTYDAEPEKELAPFYDFKICLTSDNTEVGDCNFRVGYAQKLYYGGHIGYTVYEPYRGNHYAGKACLLLCELARKHDMDYFYVTCNPENYASRKTCEYAGGVLEAIVDLPSDNDMYLEGERQKCVYRFEVKNRELIIRKNFHSWISKDAAIFLDPFTNDAVYIESWGPAYRNKKQIEAWFNEWNKENEVLKWDISGFFHTENTCICEWYFECKCGGNIDGFNGVSIIVFNEADKIVSLKEFQAKTPNIYPYDE